MSIVACRFRREKTPGRVGDLFVPRSTPSWLCVGRGVGILTLKDVCSHCPWARSLGPSFSRIRLGTESGSAGKRRAPVHTCPGHLVFVFHLWRPYLHVFFLVGPLGPNTWATICRMTGHVALHMTTVLPYLKWTSCATAADLQTWDSQHGACDKRRKASRARFNPSCITY